MARFEAKAVQEALDEAGFDHCEYSGRGMYGKQCVGVKLEGHTDAYEMFALIAGENPEFGAELARSARTDDMGLGIIVYWPGARIEEAA